MKFYSWNICYVNSDFDRALSFIAKLDFDALCLQEVPEKFLERLKGLPFNLVHASDIRRAERGTVFQNHCVILTPHAVLSSRPITYPDMQRPLRARLFQRLMWGLTQIEGRGSVLADIGFPSGRVRVFSLHLTLSYPERIAQEFDIAAQSIDGSLPSVICGDLNILESPHITVLNWLLGGRLRDIFAWRSERRDMERKFSEFKLQNPLRGSRTQTISLSQLDHILVPKNMRIVQAKVLPDRCGSDHNPVFVETA